MRRMGLRRGFAGAGEHSQGCAVFSQSGGAGRRFFFRPPNFAYMEGMTDSATMRENTSEKMTEKERSRKISSVMPLTNMMGKNTATEVSVLAKMEPATDFVPFAAASLGSSPSSSRRRVMLSMTTIELSTSMPIPSARPPRETRLREMFRAKRQISASRTESGMDSEMMRELFTFARNRTIMRNASTAPIASELQTLEILSEMYCDWSSTRVRDSPSVLLKSFILDFSASTMFVVLPSCNL